MAATTVTGDKSRNNTGLYGWTSGDIADGVGESGIYHVTSLEEIIWGATLVAITMAMHGFGMLLVLRLSSALKERFDRTPSFAKGMGTLILASGLILLVHLIEVTTS